MQESMGSGHETHPGASNSPITASSASSRNLVFDVTNWHPKPVKRPRPVKSCTECRRRKLRCDRRCPCSQCQRSYRVCMYGSGDGTQGRGNDPNNSMVDSDGSEGVVDDDDDSVVGGPGGERPAKRHTSRPISSSMPSIPSMPSMTSMPSMSSMSMLPTPSMAAGGISHHPTSAPAPPQPYSSLSLLLNPPSPTSSHAALQAPNYAPSQSAVSTNAAVASTSASASAPSGHAAPFATPASSASSFSPIPPPHGHAAASSGLHVTSSAGAAAVAAAAAPAATASSASSAPPSGPSPLLTLSGHELRHFTSSLIQEFSTRMERLEKLVLAKDAAALSAIPPFPSSATLAQLRLHQHSEHPGQRIIDASSPTVACLTANGPGNLRTRFFGQSHTRVLLNLFNDAKEYVSDKARRDTAGDLFSGLERAYTALQNDHQQSLKPISVYVDSMMPIQKRMADILPPRDVCDRLFDSYLAMSEGLYRVIHIPTFQREYEAYWASGGASSISNLPVGSATGLGSPSASAIPDHFLPRLLCIMCIGSRFETSSKGFCYDRSDGVHIPTACTLVRSWLDMTRQNHEADISTLQAELLLLHAGRMIETRSLGRWNDLGLIFRMGMIMGLHRDPSEFAYQITPFQAEFRRKLWYTILDMDLHVSLVTGLPSALRRDEFSCRPPRNLNDSDLFSQMPVLPPAKSMDHYTDGQMQAYASGTLPLRLQASDVLGRLDSLRDYSEVLAVGGALEKALDDINYIFPRNAAVATQKMYREWRNRAMLDMHLRRPLIALYRPFALSTSPESPPPSTITDVYLKSSMAILTYMEELDPTIPAFKDASHMYHVILRHDIVLAAFSMCFFIKQAVEAEAAAAAAASADTAGRSASSPLTRRRESGGSGGGAGDMHSGGRSSALSPELAKAAGYGAPSPSASAPASAPASTTAAVSASASAPVSAFGSMPLMMEGGSVATTSTGKGGSSSNTRDGNARRVYPLIWSASTMLRTVERTAENLARLANDMGTDLRDVVSLAIVLGSVEPAGSQAERDEHIRVQVRRVRDACFETLRRHSSAEIRSVASMPDMTSPRVSEWFSRPPFPRENNKYSESALFEKGFWDVWSSPSGPLVKD